MVAAIGAGDVFSKGRDFAVAGPRSQADLDRGPHILSKISKRGNRYLRVLFVQAAWVVLIKPKSRERHGLKSWIEAAKKRLHRNVLAVALANKLARIAWSVLAHGRNFEAAKIWLGHPNRLIADGIERTSDDAIRHPLPAEACERIRRNGGSAFPPHANTCDPTGPLRSVRQAIARALISISQVLQAPRHSQHCMRPSRGPYF